MIAHPCMGCQTGFHKEAVLAFCLASVIKQGRVRNGSLVFVLKRHVQCLVTLILTVLSEVDVKPDHLWIAETEGQGYECVNSN